jgi:hypothetical protein
VPPCRVKSSVKLQTTKHQIGAAFSYDPRGQDVTYITYISTKIHSSKKRNEKMKYNEEVHDQCTDLYIQFCRTILLKINSANVVIKLYNKLPNTIKTLDKIQEFKGKWQHLLLLHILYSVDEYMSFRVPLLLKYLYNYYIFMYIFFLIFSNSTKQDTKKLYITVWVLIILYINVFHYWCKWIASSFFYVC